MQEDTGSASSLPQEWPLKDTYVCLEMWLPAHHSALFISRPLSPLELAIPPSAERTEPSISAEQDNSANRRLWVLKLPHKDGLAERQCVTLMSCSLASIPSWRTV